MDVDAYGGWLPWVVFDIYAAHWLIGATVVGLLGFVGLLGMRYWCRCMWARYVRSCFHSYFINTVLFSLLFHNAQVNLTLSYFLCRSYLFPGIYRV